MEVVHGIPLEDVSSSTIRALGYADGALIVAFHSGEIFLYNNVPLDCASALYCAESRGRYFAQQIRGKFPGKRLTGRCSRCGRKGLVGAACGSSDYHPGHETERRCEGHYVEVESRYGEPIGEQLRRAAAQRQRRGRGARHGAALDLPTQKS